LRISEFFINRRARRERRDKTINSQRTLSTLRSRLLRRTGDLCGEKLLPYGGNRRSLLQVALVPAVEKENRPEVSFQGNDFRARFYFSGSVKKAAAAKQANNEHAGQQLCNHRTLRPVEHFRGCFIIAFGHLRGRAVLRLFVKINGVFFFQLETAQALYPRAEKAVGLYFQ
jgi:hypothetical protein